MEPAILAPEPGPGTLKDVRWGGSRLARLRGADPGRTIGESWEFSTLPGSESRARGETLGALLGRPLPFLAKLIDTALPLSVQVHPADDPRSGRVGKEEAWVVLDADPGSRVLCGLADGVDAATLARRVRAALAPGDEAAAGALLGSLRQVPVRRGSVVLVPAGTLHAIGDGVLLAEIQQPADCTYRLYDHGSGRELHVDQALAAVDPASRPRVWQPGEPPARLRGSHLELCILGPGNHTLAAGASERLLIPVEGPVTIRCGAREAQVGPAELRLCLGDPLEIGVAPGGLAVVGSLPGPS